MSPVKIPRRVREMKRKRPEPRRQESWRYVRLDTGWRRPRGKDSKMRLQKSGVPQLVKIGYGTPRAYKNLHPSGYAEVLVHRVEDLEGLDPEKHAIRIAGTVGRRKRIMITEEAERRGLKILNPMIVRPPEAEKPEIVRPEDLEGGPEEPKEAVSDAG